MNSNPSSNFIILPEGVHILNDQKKQIASDWLA